MVSHQASKSSAGIRALLEPRDGVHVTDTDGAYPPGPRMSRLAAPGQRPLGDSMLAYTRRMREIAQFRQDSALPTSSDPRLHKGQGLWKRGPHEPRPPPRPLSLDELMSRRPHEVSIKGLQTKTAATRRYSVPDKLPPLALPQPLAQDKDSKRLEISFVSASDLFDLVSFSLLSKTSRDESLRRARYEDSLKLLKSSDFLGSLSSSSSSPRRQTKETEEVDEGDGTFVVYGTPSPREVKKDAHRHKPLKKNDDKSRSKNEPGKSSQEDDDVHHGTPSYLEQDGRSSSDLREKQLILSQPQKLRRRPKRAKRMRLPRPQLSAIPEDELRRRQQQEGAGAQAQEAPPPPTRMPVVPTSSSLTAIRSTRKKRHGPFADPQTTQTVLDAKGDRPSDDKSPKRNSAHETNQEPPVTRKTRRSHTEPTQSGGEHPQQRQQQRNKLFADQTPKKRVPPSEDKPTHTHQSQTPRRKGTSDRLVSSQEAADSDEASRSGTASRPLNGTSLALPAPAAGSRSRVQRKFSKLIFLRDTEDRPAYHHRHL